MHLPESTQDVAAAGIIESRLEIARIVWELKDAGVRQVFAADAGSLKPEEAGASWQCVPGLEPWNEEGCDE